MTASVAGRGGTVSRVFNSETTPTERIESAKVAIRTILHRPVMCERKEKYSTYVLATLSQVKSERSKVRQTLQRRSNRESEKGRKKLKEETKSKENKTRI